MAFKRVVDYDMLNNSRSAFHFPGGGNVPYLSTFIGAFREFPHTSYTSIVFVDDFGTSMTETLAMALVTLQQLKAIRTHCLGIISHERITSQLPVRIEVKKVNMVGSPANSLD